ncbi:MAG: hypothetical protein AAFW00_19845 [Bacteroidota bacterium]
MLGNVPYGNHQLFDKIECIQFVDKKNPSVLPIEREHEEGGISFEYPISVRRNLVTDYDELAAFLNV